MAIKKYSYEDLLEIIEVLRSEEGCPWDREQTHESLIPCLLEESYELMEALQNNDTAHMREELGDVLLQVVMHCQIAKEEKKFSMDEVIDEVSAKMVYRHPHVFKSGEGVNTSQEVLDNWEKLKTEEKKEKSLYEAMERVAKPLPALVRSQKIQKKALKAKAVSYDLNESIDLLINTLKHLKIGENSDVKNGMEEKVGKILLEVVKLSAFFDINAEIALTKCLEKFINRFRYIENSRFDKV